MKLITICQMIFFTSCTIPNDVNLDQPYAPMWESKDTLEHAKVETKTGQKKDLTPTAATKQKDKDDPNLEPQKAEKVEEGKKNDVEENSPSDGENKNDEIPTKSNIVKSPKQIDIASLEFVVVEQKTLKKGNGGNFKIKLNSQGSFPKELWNKVICGVEFLEGEDRVLRLTNWGGVYDLEASSISEIKKSFGNDKTFSCKYSLEPGDEEVRFKIFFYYADNESIKTYVKNNGSDILTLE